MVFMTYEHFSRAACLCVCKNRLSNLVFSSNRLYTGLRLKNVMRRFSGLKLRLNGLLIPLSLKMVRYPSKWSVRTPFEDNKV